MQRINVIGTSCAGKTTFAAKLAAAIRAPHVELDLLHWEPGWVEVSDAIFTSGVAAATAGERWVLDGNYAVMRPIAWPLVDAVIWLDYSFPRVLWRAVTRTLGRVLRHEPCSNGNYETFRQQCSRDSIVLWVIRTHHSRRRDFRRLLSTLKSQGTRVVILRTPAEAERWLGEVRHGVYTTV